MCVRRGKCIWKDDKYLSKDHARYKHSRTSTLRPSACNCPQSGADSKIHEATSIRPGSHSLQTADSFGFTPSQKHHTPDWAELVYSQGHKEEQSQQTLEPERERSKTATYPRSASRQRTGPLVVPREQESSGRGHWALESHCTESADDARAGGIIYWTCH